MVMKIVCQKCGRFIRYEEPFQNFAVQANENCSDSLCPRRKTNDLAQADDSVPFTALVVRSWRCDRNLI